MATEVRGSARFSPGGVYRYALTRTWAEGTGEALWIMLNPSTADADTDDPTIRRVVGFSRRWGYGSAVVANLFAYRATKPADMWDARDAGIDPVGTENDLTLKALAGTANRVIVAWGANGGIGSRGLIVAEMLSDHGLWCFGKTKGGQPRHPLYVPGDTELAPWTP